MITAAHSLPYLITQGRAMADRDVREIQRGKQLNHRLLV
jgi:hypothetical protein